MIDLITGIVIIVSLIIVSIGFGAVVKLLNRLLDILYQHDDFMKEFAKDLELATVKGNYPISTNPEPKKELDLDKAMNDFMDWQDEQSDPETTEIIEQPKRRGRRKRGEE